MFLIHKNAEKVAYILNVEGVPTYLKEHDWEGHRILRIISNEKYIGSSLMQKSYVNEEGQQVPNQGEEDKYWVEDSHPAIISKYDWGRAQQIRKDRARKKYLFSGLLRCGLCGAMLRRSLQPSSKVYWTCGTYLSKGKATCRGIRIDEMILCEMTKDNPITKPMIVKEVHSENEREKSYRLIPAPVESEGGRS
ncbi:recombinase family protein [Alkalibacter sp. M17DMB]|nr:recombinase family protein [Alkalibacter mobilis]